MADLITMLSAVAGQQGGEEADENFNQTVLLLHGDGTNGAQNNTFLDSSTNNFTITRNGNTTQGTFSPFSLTDGYWSNYFDGTDDYLSVADNAVLRPGAGAFTLEAWIYRNASGAAHTIYAKGGASTGIVLQVTSGNVLRFTHTTTNIDSTGTVAANAWVHVAVVREGTGTNQTKLYINGVQDGQGTVSTDFTQTEEVRVGTNRGATDDFAGYISNVRFVKGSALYTAGFTPSTVPLTTTSQGASSSEVELLTCQSNRFVDNSTNAFAITRNGDVRVTPFSPFAPSAAYSAGTNGGSGYFDGSGDYLTGPDNAAFAFGTGDFTLECWLYTVLSSPTVWLFDFRTGATASLPTLYSTSATELKYFVAGADRITATGIPSLRNRWAHIAVSRSGTSTKLFVDGVQYGSTYTDTTTYIQAAFKFGRNENGTFHISESYCADIRVVKGTAVYTSAFTPPTAPLTAITNTSLLCNFTNAGIIDNTGKNVLETVGNAQIDTTTKKYGTGSLEFDGTGDWLFAIFNPNLDLGSGDFTIECWIYFSSLPSNSLACIVSYGEADSLPRWQLYYDSRTSQGSPGLRFSVINSGGAAIIDALGGGISGWSANTWYHIAITRSGSSFKLFRDGTQTGTTLTDADAIPVPLNGGLFVAAEPSGLSALTGFIDDLRITKGVARYTAAFTPPTKAFPDQ